jgi:CheY-like chemotaxis protein
LILFTLILLTSKIQIYLLEASSRLAPSRASSVIEQATKEANNNVSNFSKHCHLDDDIKNVQTLDGLRILVVDDDTDSLVLTTFILESYGVQTMTATSALEAFELMRQFIPDILIIDIAMPEIDGYSLIRRIRTLEPPQNEIPAIALTAIDSQEGRDLGLKSGFQSYLIKPTNPDELATEITHLLTKYSFALIRSESFHHLRYCI